MRARRIDKNQQDIVKTLRTIPGVTVAVNHDDILVGYRGKTSWFEIKNPDKTNRNGEVFRSALKPSQIKLLQEWTGHYRVVTTLDEILCDIGVTEKIRGIEQEA